MLSGHTKGIKSIAIFDPEYPVFSNSSSEQYVSPKGSSPIIVTGGLDKMIIGKNYNYYYLSSPSSYFYYNY